MQREEQVAEFGESWTSRVVIVSSRVIDGKRWNPDEAQNARAVAGKMDGGAKKRPTRHCNCGALVAALWTL